MVKSVRTHERDLIWSSPHLLQIAIIFTTSLPIRKFEQIHFFVQCFLIEVDWLGKGKLGPHGWHRVMIFID